MATGGLHDRNTTPYIAQDAGHVGEVVKRMHNSTKAKGARYKKKAYNISDQSGRTVDSWQMNEWDYKKDHLPTYARGLFTHNNNGKHEISARGYDKFFNVNEVRATEWRNVETNTRGPYELSVKENGCIIFIGGLDDNTLLVTSKHSTGPRPNNDANHALAGEAWLEKQLTALGRTRADLAKRLRSLNVTAVAELCDDSFEEHVLEYKPDVAGLYLHGMNLNLPEFATYPGNLVDKFAEEWGFRKVQYIVENDIHKVRTFLEQVGETGNYAGRDTEGFVIRCQKRDSPQGVWHDWFFKYKFEEPYLMYRQWREATKAIIAGKPPRYKKHKQITDEYLLYARRQLVKNPKIGQDFNKNHGIIAMREGFLREKGVRGSDIIRSEEQQGPVESSSTTHNVVLVPIATIGCGKTTVALALVKLFGWGHVQNDNITGKGNRSSRFALACTSELAHHSALVADRNNHQRRERQQIIADIKEVVQDAKFVALHWVHDRGNYSDIKKAMRTRIFSRGDNHQTIHADSKSENEIISIMDGFMRRFDPCDAEREPDDQFDLVIDLDPAAESRDNLYTTVNKLHEEYPKLFEMPSDEAIDGAMEWALSDYKPDLKQDLSATSAKQAKQQQKFAKKQTKQMEKRNGAKPKATRLEYFCIQLPVERLTAVLDAVFADADTETAHFCNQLKNTQRIQKEFHVTLVHRAASSQNQEYWTGLSTLWVKKQTEAKALHDGTDASANTAANSDPSAITDSTTDLDLGSAKVQLERVVWDDKVMAVLARLPEVEQNGFKSVNAMAHITVGTASEGIKPVESNALLEGWEKGTRKGVRDKRITGSVVLEGPVRAVLSR